MEKIQKKKKTLKQRISYLKRNKWFKFYSVYLTVILYSFTYFCLFMLGRSEDLYQHYCKIFECDLSPLAYENIILSIIFVGVLGIELAFTSAKLYLSKGKKKGKK